MYTMEDYKKAQDLLNIVAKDVCPNLQLEFMCNRSWPYVQTSFINVSNSVSFDNKELSINNASQITKLFRRRVERSLIDLRKKILEDLRELRRK